MKVNLSISIIAILISSFALFKSIKSPVPKISEKQLQEAMNEALRKREEEFVIGMKPKFEAMFLASGEHSESDWDPKTMEELIEPLFKTVSGVSGD